MEGGFNIEIPCDEDGFVPLQCPQCGDFFMLRPNDIETDDLIDIWCPSCGLISGTYITQDVLDLVLAIVKNAAMEEMHTSMEKLERQTRGKAVSIKVGKKPEPEGTPRIIARADALVVKKYLCCNKEAKIAKNTCASVSYCPFCGVMNLGN